MFRLFVLFAVNTLSGKVNSTPRQLVDIDGILEIVRSHDNELEYDSIPNKNTFLYGSKKIRDLKDLLKKDKHILFNQNKMKQRNYIHTKDLLQEMDKRNKRNRNEQKTSKYDSDQTKELIDNEISDGDTDQNKFFNDKALAELLSQNVLSDNAYGSSRLTPSNLVGSPENQWGDSKGYSKIYVILNPYAIDRSKNQEELNSLLSRVLSLTGQSTKLEKKNKQDRYKGFPLKKGFVSRRLRRDSRESRDSMENDYKPKRIRNDHGGVGGAGGRTAIPYIRNRGDIYERDH